MKQKESPFGQKKDLFYMKKAIALAQRAYDKEEVPVGAIVVDKKGKIIGRGYNQIEKKDTQAAHAEITAITKAGKKIGDWRLNGCWLYVSLEPCSMCMNMTLLSRIEGVVFGATSPVFGYRLDKDLTFQLYTIGTLKIVPGVLADESATLLKNFFRHKRGDIDYDTKRKFT